MKQEGFRYRRIVIALLALAVVMLALVILINFLLSMSGAGVSVLENRTLEATTITESSVFVAQAASGEVTFQISVSLDAGSAAWTVTDPTGAVRAQGSAAAGEPVSDEQLFESLSGAWEAVVETQAATGSYTLLME